MIQSSGCRSGKLLDNMKDVLWHAHDLYRTVESYNGERPDRFSAALAALGMETQAARLMLSNFTGRPETDLTDSVLGLVADPSQLIPCIRRLTIGNM